MVGPQSLPNEDRISKSVAAALAAALAGALAIALVFWITSSPGPGLDPDAASYMGAAESLAHDRGLRVPFADWSFPTPSEPLTHFPPGFPLLVATTVDAGMQPAQGARLVNALAAGASVGILTYIVVATVGVVAGLGMLAAFVFSQPLELVHLSVLSEPAFLCFVALTLLGLVRRWPALAVGVVAAAGAMVRYAGLALGAAAGLWHLLRPGTLRQRVERAVLAGGPTLLAYLGWTLHAHEEKKAEAIRKFGVYPGLGSAIAAGWRTLAKWLVPTEDIPVWTLWVAALVVLAIVGLVWLTARAPVSERAAAAKRVLAAVGTLSGCYLGLVIASRLFADPGIPFDYRLMSPLILLWAVAIVIAAASSFGRLPIVVRGAVVAAFAAWCWTAWPVEYDDIGWATSHGSDLAGEEWRTSPLLGWARTNAPRTALFSNWPSVVYFHLHRSAWLPPNMNANARTLAAFVDTLRSRRGVLLEFDVANPDALQPKEAASVPGLRAVAKTTDGTIYAAQ